jgi:hypothetical protein
MIKKKINENLFGNDSDSDFDEEMNEYISETQNYLYVESDVDEKQVFDDSDYFGITNEEFNKAPAFPIVKCPDDKILESYE